LLILRSESGERDAVNRVYNDTLFLRAFQTRFTASRDLFCAGAVAGGISLLEAAKPAACGFRAVRCEAPVLSRSYDPAGFCFDAIRAVTDI